VLAAVRAQSELEAPLAISKAARMAPERLGHEQGTGKLIPILRPYSAPSVPDV
jgi:hypothetical protein